MDTEAFIRWALDDARTVEERYTTELLVEQGVNWWWSRRKVFNRDPIDVRLARNRERKLNPAYEPHYTEDDLRKTAEVFSEMKSWSPHSDRPIRDLAVLAFLPSLEEVSLNICCHVGDVSPLARMPRLSKLRLGSPGHDFRNFLCCDFTPLARCAALRDLTLGFDAHWPDFTGIDALTQLDQLTLSGNLLALPHGISFPSVRSGKLYCQPLAARDVAALPQFPNCEFLTLSGAERLDGIERMPGLRNLELIGPFGSFEPLAALKELTCLTVTATDQRHIDIMARDVSPLVHLPKLHYLQIGTHVHCLLDVPRDYSPLVDAPALRELVVKHCPPVEVEVAAINAGLPPCDDLYLLPESRPLPALRMIIGPDNSFPGPPHREEHRGPDEAGLIDAGLRACEERWVTRFVQGHIGQRVGHQDWGRAAASGTDRRLFVTVESFECIAKVPLIIDATREAIARLRPEYDRIQFSISLKVPPPEDTEAQKELLAKFREEQDRVEFEQHERDRAEYLERLHLLELKKQEGAEITPEEFSPSERAPFPEPPWKKESEDDDDDDEGDDSDIATKEKPAPPRMFFDDEHPLAMNYSIYGLLTLDVLWFHCRKRDLAIQIMGREPDEEYPEEEKKA